MFEQRPFYITFLWSTILQIVGLILKIEMINFLKLNYLSGNMTRQQGELGNCHLEVLNYLKEVIAF
jgi:hypothetical protein